MIMSSIKDFNTNFFNLYNFNDFEQIPIISNNYNNLKEDKNSYFTINDIKYNCYYLIKAFNILGEKSKIFQHKRLKLLFIKNSKYAALICPKF